MSRSRLTYVPTAESGSIIGGIRLSFRVRNGAGRFSRYLKNGQKKSPTVMKTTGLYDTGTQLVRLGSCTVLATEDSFWFPFGGKHLEVFACVYCSKYIHIKSMVQCFMRHRGVSDCTVCSLDRPLFGAADQVRRLAFYLQNCKIPA